MSRTQPLMLSLGAVAVAAATWGCVSTHRADLRALGHRAVYDLGCPIGQLQLDHVDARTKAVAGCGRRLVYVEDCDSHDGSRLCTWHVDTPSVEQQSWPQAYAAYYPAPSPPLGRKLRTELFGPGEGPETVARPEDPLDIPAAPASSGRAFATELFQPGADRTPSDRPPRTIRTGLSSDEGAPAAGGSPRKVRTELFPEAAPPKPDPGKAEPNKADPTNPFDL